MDKIIMEEVLMEEINRAKETTIKAATQIKEVLEIQDKETLVE